MTIINHLLCQFTNERSKKQERQYEFDLTKTEEINNIKRMCFETLEGESEINRIFVSSSLPTQHCVEMQSVLALQIKCQIDNIREFTKVFLESQRENIIYSIKTRPKNIKEFIKQIFKKEISLGYFIGLFRNENYIVRYKSVKNKKDNKRFSPFYFFNLFSQFSLLSSKKELTFFSKENEDENNFFNHSQQPSGITDLAKVELFGLFDTIEVSAGKNNHLNLEYVELNFKNSKLSSSYFYIHIGLEAET